MSFPVRASPLSFASGASAAWAPPRRRVAQQSVNRIIYLRIGRYLRKISAHQSEVMPVIEFADPSDSVQCTFIPYMAAKCISRIRWINHHATLTDNVGRLPNQARLGVVRVNLEKLAHGLFSLYLPSGQGQTDQRCQTPLRPSKGDDSTPTGGRYGASR